MTRKPAPRRGLRPGRGSKARAADRALFEQAVARLGAAPLDKAEDELAGIGSERTAEAGRRARFTKRAGRGEVEPDATIDLHGLDRDAATHRLRTFLSGSSREVEVVLVVHGRGEGILAAAAEAELDRHPRVAEHLSAPRRLGGAGARLARLRQTGGR
jgi:DNA-nicking Smr family endonuclease